MSRPELSVAAVMSCINVSGSRNEPLFSPSLPSDGNAGAIERVSEPASGKSAVTHRISLMRTPDSGPSPMADLKRSISWDGLTFDSENVRTNCAKDSRFNSAVKAMLAMLALARAWARLRSAAVESTMAPSTKISAPETPRTKPEGPAAPMAACSPYHASSLWESGRACFGPYRRANFNCKFKLCTKAAETGLKVSLALGMPDLGISIQYAARYSSPLGMVRRY